MPGAAATATEAAQGLDIKPFDIIVAGAGVVGMATALYLQKDGHRVTVIDPRDPGMATSFGNAGGVVTAGNAPLVTGQTLKKVPGMLLDPENALRISWRYLPQLAPWLLRLALSARAERVEAASKALASLNALAEPAWWELSRLSGVEDLLKPRGWLKVFGTKAGFDDNAAEREMLARRGAKVDVLNRDELRQLEPNMAPIFHGAVFFPDCLALVNPFRAVDGFAAEFQRRGGVILKETVTAIEPGTDACQVVSDSGSRSADRVVLAAGAWSKGFARQLGLKPPLETERGYHLMLPAPEKNLNRPVLNMDKSFCLCPMETGVRLTSGDELAGLAAPPDYTPIRRILPLAKNMLPSLDLDEQSAWMGYRPSMPDSLPAIGPAPRDPRVFFAFGHGHYGMTQGPATGRVIADMIAGRDPGFLADSFSPNRA